MPAVLLSAVLLSAAVLVAPADLAAQVVDALSSQTQDARIPRHGEVWFEVFPSFDTWSEQFALDSPLEGTEDGEREPLEADVGGPILDRVFPSLSGTLAESLNQDAGALGFDALQPEEVSVGGLDFGTINAQVRRLNFGIRIGLLNHLSLEAEAPLVFTEVEPLFAFDTLSATVGRAAAALPGSATFFDEFAAAREMLEGMVAEGSLTPEQEAEAQALLDSSGLFLNALQRRVMEDLLLPLAGSSAGSQMTARFSSLTAGFSEFGLSLPVFPLRETASSAELAAFFAAPPVSGLAPGITERTWTVGEVEAGLRLGILDTFRPGRSVRARTTLGGKVRLPLREADRDPFHVSGDFLGLPVGDGQRDIEAAFFQDLQLGGAFLLSVSARYGIQRPDELTLRVRPPDRPWALEETEAVVERDLGDYVQVRALPQLLLNRYLSVGAEYGYWRKEPDAYRLVGDAGSVPDASPLEVETEQRLHRLGVALIYRPENPAFDPDPGPGWEFGFVFQTAIAGSGGQTPAAQRVLAAIRLPIRL